MKRLFLLAAIVLVSAWLVHSASSQQMETYNKPTAGIDWYAKVMRERAIKDRAAEERSAMKQAARSGGDVGMAGLTVDAYNKLILKKNATKLK